MKKGIFSQFGTVLFAVLASSCCLLPMLFTLLGVGGISFATVLTPYKYPFMALTVFSLSISFYFSYRKPKNCDDGNCENPNLRIKRLGRIMLWLVTAFSLGVVFYELSH